MDLTDLHFMLFIRLLLSHLLTDFVLQLDDWVNDKKVNIWRSGKLYLHGFLAGLLAYLLVGGWQYWWLLFLVGISHIIIDGIKSTLTENIWVFLIDQLLHIIVLVIGWIIIVPVTWYEILRLSNLMLSDKLFIYLLAYLLVLWPSGQLIKNILISINQNFKESIEKRPKNVGLWIGMIERLLILTFILQNNYQIIGFLFAAKSIFRHRRIESETSGVYLEYILLGTLISFLMAILVGLMANYLLLLL